MRKQQTLDTIWEVPDELWAQVEPSILEVAPPKPRGRKRANPRQMLNGVIFRLRSGCQWNKLPKELGDDSTIHRTFQLWVKEKLFSRIWAVLVERCEEMDGVDWEWQAADASMGKARLGGDEIGPNPTDRGKAGTKRSLLVEAKGGPLSVVVAGANVHDTKLLQATLEAIVVARPEPRAERPQNLCLDKGYDNPTGHRAAAAHGFQAHIRRIGEEKLDASGQKRYPARRWVVERTLAWLSKCRAILVRYDKKAANFLGLLQLACALLWFRWQWHLAFLR